MIYSEFRLITFAALVACVPSAAGAQVRSLTWLAGCWETSRGNAVVVEEWSRPRGGVMFGHGQTIRGDSTIDFEQTRIFDRAGKTVYAANPSGQAPAEFVAEQQSNTFVVFANPAHDFPQRVSYRRVGSDSLVARVEGNTANGLRGTDFRYRRVPCRR